MNKISEKIKKGGKIGQIISTAMIIAMIIMLVIVCTLFTVQIIFTVSNSGIGVLLPWLTNILALFIAIFVSWNLRAAFKAIRNNGTPFIPVVPKKLKLIGWFMVAVGIIMPTLNFVMSLSIPIAGISGIGWSVFTGFIGIFLANGGFVSPAMSVFTGFISIFLATMFNYGCQLQTESDQTL
jgi:hypothetical protein